MCSRFAQFRSARAYAEQFAARLDDDAPDEPGLATVSPTDDAFVLRRHPETGALHLSRLRFGLVPVWSKDASRAARLINARSESVAETASFRGAWLKARRCIVPVEGFYEWARGPAGKQPYFFTAKDNGPLALAGLWEGWKDPQTGQWLRTFTILTCPSNALIAPLHDRMPVILGAADIPAYLEDRDPRTLLAPYPAEKMVHRPVDARAPAPASLFDRPDA